MLIGVVSSVQMCCMASGLFLQFGQSNGRRMRRCLVTLALSFLNTLVGARFAVGSKGLIAYPAQYPGRLLAASALAETVKPLRFVVGHIRSVEMLAGLPAEFVVERE